MSKFPNGFGMAVKYKHKGTPSVWNDSDKFKGTRKNVRALAVRIKEHRTPEPFIPDARVHPGSPTSRYAHKAWPF